MGDGKVMRGATPATLTTASRAPLPDNAAPLAAADAATLFGPLKSYAHVVFAVSGGADSLALMHLARCFEWGDTPVSVVTIDHQLRDASRDEAQWVGDLAESWGFAHETLAWDHTGPSAQDGVHALRSGLQAAAREARYALLTQYAAQFSQDGKPAAVVTAHTLEDQAETLLMRLARGSGLDGLASMAPTRPLLENRVDLVRPLLMTSRDRLVATLQGAGQSWLEDPSNSCTDFERVRVRNARDALEALGLTPAMLGLSAERLQRARGAVEDAANAWLTQHVDFHEGVFAAFPRAAFVALSAELQNRVLAWLIDAFGGADRPPRLSKVERLVSVLCARQKVAVTLGGAMLSAGSQSVRVYREPERSLLTEAVLLSGSSPHIWDQRFRVWCATAVGPGSGVVSSDATPLAVRPVGADAVRHLTGQQAFETDGLPARAITGLPGFYDGADLVAVPQLGVVLSETGETCRSEFIGGGAIFRPS